MKNNKRITAVFITAFSILIAALLVLGTLWMGNSSKKDADKAVRTVSLLYLDELAEGRKQVVENDIENNIKTIRVAIDLLTESDLSDKAHLEAYQLRMKKLYELDKFAFVDTNGLIYTSVGTLNNIDEYGFDYQTITQPEISVFNENNTNKKVVIAVPVNVEFDGKTLCVCFMEMDMKVLLARASMGSKGDAATVFNIYTKDGIALSKTASESLEQILTRIRGGDSIKPCETPNERANYDLLWQETND